MNWECERYTIVGFKRNPAGAWKLRNPSERGFCEIKQVVSRVVLMNTPAQNNQLELHLNCDLQILHTHMFICRICTSIPPYFEAMDLWEKCYIRRIHREINYHVLKLKNNSELTDMMRNGGIGKYKVEVTAARSQNN